MNIKVFTAESGSSLENDVNEWLANNPSIEVVNMVQSESNSDKMERWIVTLTLLYKGKPIPTGIKMQKLVKG